MIALVDSGVANLTSVVSAFNRLGVDPVITDDPARIQTADRVVLPGVGAAAAAMGKLAQKGLVPVLQSLKQPVLGICLGMQLLFEESEEGGGCACLGVIKGRIVPLKTGPDLPVPHMGWNRLLLKTPDHPLLEGITDGAYMYFVHSFAAPVNETTRAAAYYGEAFTAVVARGNYMGCQFHPERSGDAGSRILRNFLEIRQ